MCPKDSDIMSNAELGPKDLLEELRGFLHMVDTNREKWIDDVVNFVDSRLNGVPSNHSRLFTIGGDESDGSDDSLPLSDSDVIIVPKPTLPVPTSDRASQYNDDEFDVKPSNGLTLDHLKSMWKNGERVSPGDALRLLKCESAKLRDLEPRFGDFYTAIAVRRQFIAEGQLPNLPYRGYDYKYVVDSCCENVIGYMPIPTGVAGPLRVNGKNVFVPMTTTEGALVASTNRGCSAIQRSGGIHVDVFKDGMTRAPVVKFASAREAVYFVKWLRDPTHFQRIKAKFEESSRFARLQLVDPTPYGNQVFIRFEATTGDAMGMNMVSKGCDNAMKYLKDEFPDMQLIALSGNYCVDKKAAFINVINGRGKSVISECILPASVVKSVLKTSPRAMVEACRSKLECGSARAGTIGGQNAHAANVVAAIFLATGQDAAQVVSSSMCFTHMELSEDEDLVVTCTMPCLEVGTVGGGTILPPQNDCLKMLECAGAHPENPGANASRLAEIICATVLAGELSLMAALVTDQLVSSHMKLNRSKLNLYPSASTPGSTAPGMKVPSSLLNPQDTVPIIQRTKRTSESQRGAPNCSNIL